MLSAYLVPFERAFCFQIAEQDSKLSRALQDHGSYLASNGWTVTRANAPEINLGDKTIYLRGDNGDKDLRVHRIWDLSNDTTRDTILNQINDALQEFVNFASMPVVSTPMQSYDIDPGWLRRNVYNTLGTVSRSQPKSNQISSKPIIRA